MNRNKEQMKTIDNQRAGKAEQRRFYLLIALFFVAIFMFNYFTPMLSDDYAYARQAREAGSLLDLIRQEQNQYMTWTGRSVNHMILRIFFTLPNMVFKVLNSVAFIVLSLVLYHFVDRKKKYDSFIFLGVQMGLWLFAVDFRQTILWETGACNYLWGTMIILSFMAVMRDLERNAVGRIRSTDQGIFLGETSLVKTVLMSVGMFLFGTLAGWCNENTSGGCLLFALVLMGIVWVRKHKISIPMLLGVLGNCFGLFMMVRAPGNANRASFAEENYSGLAGKIARFQKITLNVRNEFWILLCVLIGTSIIAYLLLSRKEPDLKKQKELIKQTLAAPLFYAALFVITSYALILTAETQPRAYFGAGLFLLIACLQNVRNIVDLEKELGTGILARTLSYSALGILMLHFVFTYMDCGTNLFRIHRDCTEREAFIEQKIAEGEDDITIAQVHPAFYNEYSAIEEMELGEDPGFWTNVGMEEYYGVSAIRAIPYDDWATANGLELRY